MTQNETDAPHNDAQHINIEQDKRLECRVANAIISEHAVVVHQKNALPTLFTVVNLRGLQGCFTLLTGVQLDYFSLVLYGIKRCCCSDVAWVLPGHSMRPYDHYI